MKNEVERTCERVTVFPMAGREYSAEEIRACVARHGLLSAELEMTNACNLRCQYCYSAAGAPVEDELTLPEIKNVTAQKMRRVDMTFGVSYSDDIPKTEKVLADILEEHPKVLDDPEPMIKLHNLGDSSIDFIVRPWVKTEDYWDVYWDVTREVKMRFDREGISIPFPQRDVHYYEDRKLPPAAP